MTGKLNFINAERPTTCSTSVKLDLRTAATLLLFWDKQGEQPRSMAETLRLSLETFRDVVTQSNPSIELTSSGQAIKVVQSYGFDDPLGPTKRNRASLVKQLSLASALAAGYQPTERFTKHDKVVTSQQVALAAQKFDELTTGDLESAHQRRLDELKNACTTLLTTPEATDE